MNSHALGISANRLAKRARYWSGSEIVRGKRGITALRLTRYFATTP